MSTYDLRSAIAGICRPADTEIASSPLLRTSNVDVEVFHLVRGQRVPPHRHSRGDDIFIGVAGSVTVTIWDNDDRPSRHQLTHSRIVVVPAGRVHAVRCEASFADYALLQTPVDANDIEFQPHLGDADNSIEKGHEHEERAD